MLPILSRRTLAIGMTVALLIASPLTQAKNEKFTRRQSVAKGLPAAIAVVAPKKNKRNALRAINRAFTRARHVLTMLDERKEGSETHLLNSHAGGTPVKAGRQLQYLLAKGGHVSTLTGGAFDLTLGSRSRKASYRDIWIDPANSLAAIKRKRVRVSVWGIARGYLADGIAKTLNEEGFHHFLVNVGGKLWASGKDVNGSWVVGIQDPFRALGESVCRLPLLGQGLATSSFKAYRIDIGSKLASPVFVSVSVVAPDAATADALSHAGMTMDEKAYSIFRNISGVGAVFISRSGKVHKVGRIPAACFSS